MLKHAALVRLVRAMQRKEKGFLYIDTHAGRGRYDLVATSRGDTLERAPEWPDGIGRLWARGDLPETVADYVAQVRIFDQRQGNVVDPQPHFYPGSPRLVRALMRPQDRMALFEKQPEESARLKEEFLYERGVSVQTADGYTAMRGQLPPSEKRALVLIDPPFEARDEFKHIAAAVDEGLHRLPAGTFAIWYPLTERARVDIFFSQLMAMKLPPTFALELTVVGPAHPLKMKGCGLMVINPPWQIDRELDPLGTWLAGMLSQASGGDAILHWLVREG